METRDWEQIEDLFHAAMVMDARERLHYLRQACTGNESLQKEVESLISALESSDDLMEQPAFELGMRVLLGNQADSMVGTLVGAYKIIRLLGRGGMGEVYLAEDTRLGRKVALKFLTTEFVGDNWAKRQLIKEAQAVAMLDHPNICPVYGIEEHEGHSFMVMQFVEGKTLAEMIRDQVLPADKVLPLAQQMVGALAEAHAHGIIHRDIKPKNIMVTNSGQVKVLDFGLAKTIQQKHSMGSAADTASDLSHSGLIPGTIAYMSPEQLRAEKLDYRSDIFSLGTVLYEMVTGKNPYAHDTNAEIISAVLTIKPPSLKHNTSQIPRGLVRIVQKCLQKEKSERYQSANELLIELETYEDRVDSVGQGARHLSVRATTAVLLLMLVFAITMFVYNHLTRPRTLAILPFANETGDTSLDYLGDGLTESLINKLSGLSKLRVKTFGMVAGYKGQIDPQKIARELKVDEVVVGRIKGTRKSLSLETVMIDAVDGSQRWSKTLPMELEATLPVLDEISKDVTSHLEFWSRTDEAKIANAHRPPAAAFDEYLRGLDSWSKRRKDNIKEAIAHFEEATRLDPSYAQAYAARADCYVLLNVVSYGSMDTKEAMAKAKWAAARALEIDPRSAEAHSALGVVELRGEWHWRAAAREFELAIELKPDYAPAHLWYSDLLAITGELEKAMLESERARDLDPFSAATSLNYCRSFYFSRQYDEATRCLDKVNADYPGYRHGEFLRGYIDIKKGMYSDAIDIFERIYANDKAFGGAALGYLYGITGRQPEARRILSEMLKLAEEYQAKQQELPPQEIAFIYLGLGDRETAFAWLEKSADEHFWPFTSVAVDPFFDSERSDPRFINLVGRLNLPQSH